MKDIMLKITGKTVRQDEGREKHEPGPLQELVLFKRGPRKLQDHREGIQRKGREKQYFHKDLPSLSIRGEAAP